MREPKWKGKHYAFYQNRECEYFPCHKGISEEDFNCLFCYCPLYMLGKECGGNSCYTDSGRKDCTACTFPHHANNYGRVVERYKDIANKMAKDEIQLQPEVVHKNQKTLRRGITTGTCCAAAAFAAASQLLLGISRQKVLVDTPKGVRVEVPVQCVTGTDSFAEYSVIKDSGDDPDVTNGMALHVKIEKLQECDIDKDRCFVDKETVAIYLDGGVGIGRVTKEGLEQMVGQPAFNEVPRKMIFDGVKQIVSLTEIRDVLKITIFAPEGEEIAKRTFNGRLGIEGGISILGTSGILEPMSEKAIVDTIEVEIKQLATVGQKKLLVTPGNYGQSYASNYLGFDIGNSVKCSNYIGETIDLAISYGIETFLLVGNIGKLIKLAAGIMNTHSKVADGRGEIMALHAVLCGGTAEMARSLLACINTDEMLGLLEEWELKDQVIHSICEKIEICMKHRIGDNMQFGVVLFSEKYGYLGETSQVQELIDIFRE